MTAYEEALRVSKLLWQSARMQNFRAKFGEVPFDTVPEQVAEFVAAVTDDLTPLIEIPKLTGRLFWKLVYRRARAEDRKQQREAKYEDTRRGPVRRTPSWLANSMDRDEAEFLLSILDKSDRDLVEQWAINRGGTKGWKTRGLLKKMRSFAKARAISPRG